jgi:hypothetical protein
LAKWLAQSINLREKVLQRKGLQTLEGETLGGVKLGLGRLLFSTYNFNASSEERKTSVATARPYLLSSMAENYFSTREHVTMTYLCAFYLGF